MLIDGPMRGVPFGESIDQIAQASFLKLSVWVWPVPVLELDFFIVGFC